ncbi:MAG: hypothetical protein EBT80_02710 [Chitinophagales bacterium]|nr:hypothetical protein [Chitinophagales bacterium]
MDGLAKKSILLHEIATGQGALVRRNAPQIIFALIVQPLGSGRICRCQIGVESGRINIKRGADVIDLIAE